MAADPIRTTPLCMFQGGCDQLARHCWNYCTFHHAAEKGTSRLYRLFLGAESPRCRAVRERQFQIESQRRGHEKRWEQIYLETSDFLDAGDHLEQIVGAAREADPVLADSLQDILEELCEHSTVLALAYQMDEPHLLEAPIRRFREALVQDSPFQTYQAISRYIQRIGCALRRSPIPMGRVMSLLVAANQLQQGLAGYRPSPILPQGLARFATDHENVHTPITVGFVEHVTSILERRWTEQLDRPGTWLALQLIDGRATHHFSSPAEKNAIMSQLLWDRDNSSAYWLLLRRMASEIRSRDEAVKCQLLRRLVEELMDGYDKCIQGKLSRLCNVLQGFDEEVDALCVRAREDFQNAVAAVAQRPASERRAALDALFVEYAALVPAAEHGVWAGAVFDV